MKRYIFFCIVALFLAIGLTSCVTDYPTPSLSSTTSSNIVSASPTHLAYYENISKTSKPTGIDVTMTIDNILVGEPLVSTESYRLMEQNGKTYICLDYSYETMEKASVENGVVIGGGKTTTTGTLYSTEEIGNVGQFSASGLSFDQDYIQRYTIEDGTVSHTKVCTMDILPARAEAYFGMTFSQEVIFVSVEVTVDTANERLLSVNMTIKTKANEKVAITTLEYQYSYTTYTFEVPAE